MVGADYIYRQARLIPLGEGPQKFCLYAYSIGDVSFEEAHAILVGKYRYGKQGAAEALRFVKKYPHLCHKPTNYDEIMKGGPHAGSVCTPAES